MKFSEGRTGRIFVLRLEQGGEKIPEVIESFAGEQGGVPAALVFFFWAVPNEAARWL